jgi:hypothetical protein
LTAQLLLLAQDNMPGPWTMGGFIVLLVGAVGVLFWQDKTNTKERIAKLQEVSDAQEARLRERADARERELIARCETLQKLADNATMVAEQLALHDLQARNLPVVAPLARIVPLHQSPVTDDQVIYARIYDTTARIAAATLAARIVHPDIDLPKPETAAEVESHRAKESQSESAGGNHG